MSGAGRTLALLGLVAVFGVHAGPARAVDAAPSPAEVAASYAALQERIIEVSRLVTPWVVHVEAIVRVNDRRKQVTGSGFVVSADGHILTNQHVVEKAQKVTVLIAGRKGKIPARIVGTDKQTDIALLEIDPPAEPLAVAALGSAETLEVGQWVLAVGNPYGLDGTVSLGIVSAKGRNLAIPQLLNDFIQTDAMIDRGSSGGPLVNLEGRVVGINSRGQGRGIGFTIPIDTALQVMAQMLEGGVARGWLGVGAQPLDRELAAYFGEPDLTGVVITSVSAGSPAERGGLRAGDILTHFGGEPVEAEKTEDLGRFQRQVASHGPGAVTELRFRRGREERSVRVALREAPKVEPDEVESDFGFHVQEITEGLYRAHRLPQRDGAFVSFVARGSPAAEAGLSNGDIIAEVEGRAVDDLGSFRSAMSAVHGRPRFLITALRGDERVLVLVRPGGAPRPPTPPAGAAGAAGDRNLPD